MSYPPYYAEPAHAPSPPRSKAMAIWALVLALLGVCGATALVALVLAIVALSRVRAGRAAGKGMAIAALVISLLWLLAFAIGGVVLAVFVGSFAERDSDGIISEPGRLFLEDLRDGDCLKDLEQGTPLRLVDAVPCDDPHLHQVFGFFELEDGPFPGQAEVDRVSERRCYNLLADFTGSEVSELELIYLRPDAGGWSLDRGVTCLATTGEIVTDSFERPAG
ncbi:MAG TPA: DUF4190 domain-containing protein [Nocardioidaceae bacterium]|nr:DUF4190 domain-containing protein [Nocardioidaceae bacterium]